MNNRFYAIFAVMFIAAFIEFLSFSSAHAQSMDEDSLVSYWHKAYFSELNGHPEETIAIYNKVIELSLTEPLDIREWFQGTSFFGMALASVRAGDKVSARTFLAKALLHHYWNFKVVSQLKIFDSICGKIWIDSISCYWKTVKENERPFWHAQPTFVLKPKILSPNVKYPLVIALHGGTDCYERLVKRLEELPDSASVIIAIPAGVHRLSEVSNSWDDDDIAASVKIEKTIQEMSQDPNVDKTNISLLGFSQGSQISYEYAFSHSDQIRNVIAFAGFAPAVIEPEKLKDAARHHLKVIACSGLYDSQEFLESSRGLEREAKQAGLDFDLRIESDLPHGFPLKVGVYFAKIWRELELRTKSKPGSYVGKKDKILSPVSGR